MTKLSLAASINPDQQYDSLSWGIVELQVTNLERAVAFWTTTLGLIDRNHAATGVALDTTERTLFILHSGAKKPAQAAYTGMYHVAIGVRTQGEFSRMLARLIYLDVQVSPTDHLLAKSLYLSDPDGLEIEITLETPDRFERFGDTSKGLTLYDTEGNSHNGRGPLDVIAELAHAKGADLMAPLASTAYLAHLHFKVANLEPALDWFENLGFERHLTLDNWGFADMGVGAPNTHRLAMNIWAGPNHPPAPQDMARLVRYELIVHDPNLLKHARLPQVGDDFQRQDPTGVTVTLRSATP